MLLLLLLVQLVPPEVTDTPEAPKQAKEKLRQMGSLSRCALARPAAQQGQARCRHCSGCYN